MKKRFCYPVMMMLTAIVINLSAASSLFGRSDDRPLTIWSSPELSELAKSLVTSYNEANPGMEANFMIIGEESSATSFLASENLGLICEDQLSLFSGQKYWKLAIGRDIIIPVMSKENPLLGDIQRMGVSPAEFTRLFTSAEKPDWGFLSGTENKKAISCWCLTDQPSSGCIAEFLGSDPLLIHAKFVGNREDIQNYISNDPYAIGFCRLSELMDPESELSQKVTVIPIDLNGDNQINHFENIYSNISVLERGAWIGKYPKSLVRNIYITAGAAPASETEQSFLAWLITDGQPQLHNVGYSELVSSERKSKLQAIFADQKPLQPLHEKPMGAINILYISGLIIAGLFLLFIIGRIIRGKRIKSEVYSPKLTPSFTDKNLVAPEGLFFDKSHTWAFMEKDGYVKTGIDDFLQHVTGTITRVKMKKAGEKVTRGETFFTMVQQGKQLEIKSPVSGIIIETNSYLSDDAHLLNESPYGNGWIYKIKTGNWMKEIKRFFMVDSYREWAKSEFLRLKDFLSLTVKPHAPGQVQLVMQDGGELKDGVLEHFGPDVWEEFQIQFIKNS